MFSKAWVAVVLAVGVCVTRATEVLAQHASRGTVTVPQRQEDLSQSQTSSERAGASEPRQWVAGEMTLVTPINSAQVLSPHPHFEWVAAGGVPLTHALTPNDPTQSASGSPTIITPPDTTIQIAMQPTAHTSAPHMHQSGATDRCTFPPNSTTDHVAAIIAR
jgi:hypothetical protein